MHKIKYVLVFILFIFVNLSSYTQEIGIDQWREHLPYSKCISVADANDIIYCATPYCLFYYNKVDNSIFRLSKVNGLSDIGLSWMEYNKNKNILAIAYSNSNIDLIKEGEVINISDIKRKEILGNKTINKVQFLGKYAYLCCGFGIVVLDLDKEEIKDTWYIGDNGTQVNVLDIALNTNDSTVWAATDAGIFYADYNGPLISSYTSWTHDERLTKPDNQYNNIVFFNNQIYTNLSGTPDVLYRLNGNQWEVFLPNSETTRSNIRAYSDKLVICSNGAIDIYNTSDSLLQRITSYANNPSGWPQPKDAVIDNENNMWIADNTLGMVENYGKWNFQQFLLNGPAYVSVFSIAAKGNNIWAVSGGRTQSWAKTWNWRGIYSFSDNQWYSYNRDKIDAFDTITDFVCVAVDPFNSNKAYIGTFDKGLLEITDGVLTNIYDQSNSTLRREILVNQYTMVSGVCFDQDNNLWVTCSQTNAPLSKRSPDGTWTSYDLGSALGGQDLGALLVDKYGQKWILTRHNYILVVNASNTQVKKLTSATGNGNIPGNFLYSIAQDQDGAIWLGTDEGVVVFYSPENVFTGENFDAQKILLEVGGYWQYLLETEAVNAIAIDGGNRKWFGTEKSGAFLMSSDGTKQVSHFTTEDSPLFSNAISAIAIDDDGEVFFGTSEGIISYKGTASNPDPDTKIKDAYAFPNPVRESYHGNITIKGLAENSNVKITDIAGNVVFTTSTKKDESGGEVIWDGNSLDGKRAHTGVYLVFVVDENGSNKEVAKILFIN